MDEPNSSDLEQPLAMQPARARLALAICAALFVSFALTTIQLWEYRHDEGFTFSASFAQGLNSALSSPGAQTSDAFDALEARLSGSGARVYEALQGKRQQHPPAYYLVAYYWSQLFGTGRFGLRLLGVALGVLSILGVHALGRRLAGPTAGIGAALLLAACPWFHAISVFARPYSLAIALVIWSSVAALACCRDGPRKRAQVAWVVLTAAGIYTLYHFVFVAAWQVSMLLLWALRQPSKRRARAIGLACALPALSALAFVPWLPHFLSHLEQTQDSFRYSGTYPLAHWPAHAAELGARLFVRGADACRPALAVLAALSLLAIASQLLRRNTETAASNGSRLAANTAWWTLPLLPAGMLIGDLVHDSHTFFLAKYCFALLPFLIILAVAGWSRFGKRGSRIALALWSVLLATASGMELMTRHEETGSMRIAAEYVARQNDPSHAVILGTTRPGYAIPFLLYLREQDAGQLRVLARRDATPLDLFSELARDDAIERITMVDLRVSYDTKSSWTQADLFTLEKRARRSGWQVVLADPSQPIADRAPSARVLTVLTPIKASFLTYPH